jgi:hypothetical protein
MSMTQKLKLALFIALVTSGAIIASSGKQASAQVQPCLPDYPCDFPVKKPKPHPPNPPARPIPSKFDNLQKHYPQVLQQMQKEDPQAIEKLQQGNPETLRRLQQLIPKSTQ